MWERFKIWLMTVDGIVSSSLEIKATFVLGIIFYAVIWGVGTHIVNGIHLQGPMTPFEEIIKQWGQGESGSKEE